MATTRELEVIWRIRMTVDDDRALGMCVAAVLARIASGELVIPAGEEAQVTVTADRKNPHESGITMPQPVETTVTVRNSFVNVYREDGRVMDVAASPDIEEAARREHMPLIENVAIH